ncbi:MAG TPA: response regulator [Candidatus Wallbacteria bacterium]|nr:response regulator [Candidatus Wallbacteria bacterium]
MPDKIKIMFVEDEIQHIDLIESGFEEKMEFYELRFYRTLEEADQALDEFKPDLILSDWKLPDGEGTRLIKKDQYNWPFYPVIIMTSHGNESVAVEAMKAGAIDYIVKSSETLLNMDQVVQRGLREWRNMDNVQKTERKLCESEMRYRELIDNANDIIYTMDLEGNFTSINKAAEEHLGYDKNECGSIKLKNIVAPEYYEFVINLVNLRGCGEMNRASYELELISKNGKRIFFDIKSFVRLLHGKPFEVFGIARNISERKKMENELLKAKERAEEASRAKSLFLSNMSHEIRTPMHGIIGFSNLLIKTPLNECQKDFLSTIKTCSTHLMDIINDILDFSKIEANKLNIEYKPFEIENLVHESLDFFEESIKNKKLSVSLDIDKKIKYNVIGDRLRIKQILLNIISNAIKFTQHGGITIGVMESDKCEKNVTIKFYVKDTGIGIPNEKLDEIFERFSQGDISSTKKYGGIGLGLSIVNELLKLMGGRINVESAPGSGSNFIFELNFETIERETSLNAEIKPVITELNLHTSSYNILAVDDDVVGRAIIEKYLSGKGFNYKIVMDGREALEALERQKFDMVFMDIQMPVLDGISATKIIREKESPTGGHTPIIALTAYALPEEQIKMVESGIDECLTKPLDDVLLWKVIDKYLKK